MPLQRPRTHELFDKVYSALVANAGAPESNREYFVQRHVAWSENPYETTEFRFMGRLGFGGKFWCTPDSFHISFYSEDSTPAREEVRIKTNEALKKLFVAPEVCLACEYERKVGNPSPNPHACEE
jgi:hypothetical protein